MGEPRSAVGQEGRVGWIRRLRNTLTGGSRDSFEEEARFHLERRIERLVARGVTPEQARLEARRSFGSIGLAHERTRDADTLPWLRDLGRDLRYAIRQLHRNPGFALTTILVLAIGLGANTALFTVVDEVLLKRLNVPASEELVLLNWREGRTRMRNGMDGVITRDEATGRATSTSFSYPTFEQLRRANDTLSELFAFYPIQQLNVVADDTAEVASGQFVSGNYFRGLGVDARVGRTIADVDDRRGAPPVALISHRYWQRRFASDPGVVGRVVRINRIAFTVIGITPAGFEGTLDVAQAPDYTLPFAVERLMHVERSDLDRPAFLWVHLMGRLTPGRTREQTAATLNGPMQRAMLEEWRQAMAMRQSTAGGDTSRTIEDASTLRVESGSQGLMDSRRRYAQPLLVLVGCAALVLVVTCINLANLLLSRSAARQREIATRLALGARRGRLVRQLFTESLLLATVGSAAGLALARWGADLLMMWRPFGGQAVLEGALDWRVLAFCAAMAALTSVLFGLAPAIYATRAELSQFARRTSGGPSARLGRVLVVAQVAVSLVLVVAAVLFVGTLRNLRSVDAGFNLENLLLFRVQPQLNGYRPTELPALYARMMERVAAVPGVRSATVSRHSLLSFSRRSEGITIEGSAATGDGAEVNVVAPNFFETMEIPLLLGRTFEERDGSDAASVAIVNQVFAARHFGGGNPVGRRLWLGESRNRAPIEIVGMTRDAKYTDLRNPTRPTVYIPIRQAPPGQANFEVRTAGDPLALAPAIRQAIRELDATLPLFDIRSQADQAKDVVARETAFARLSGLLGAIALALAAIGVYGTMSYAIARRTMEIGIRMALGARRGAVVRMVLRDALLMTLAGVAVGLPCAIAASRASAPVLDQLLFGLSANDPWVLGGAAGMLIAVAVLASLLPARRASTVDPIVALQAE
jgi:predicted permease